MAYETSVANGSLPVFYTRQFEGTIPYLFQFTHIFPYVSGLPVFVLAIFSLAFILKSYFINHKSKPISLVFFFSCLIYFLYFGQLFTKWTRFVSPLFFVFPLLASVAILKIKTIPLRVVSLLICLVPGLLFFSTYLKPDIRLTASQWIVGNIPAGSTVLSEGGNVINLPVGPNNLNVINFDFYQLDADPSLPNQLESDIARSDYILVPSRRIFANQNNSAYPVSRSYYQRLFSGQLGFKLIKTFTQKNYFIINPENAEETYTVFDSPTLRLYQKI